MGYFSIFSKAKVKGEVENKYKDVDAAWEYLKEVDKRFYMDRTWNEKIRTGQADDLNVIFRKEGREPELLVCAMFCYITKAEPSILAAHCLTTLLTKEPLANLIFDTSEERGESTAQMAAALEGMYRLSF
jgi:hypothetical protein